MRLRRAAMALLAGAAFLAAKQPDAGFAPDLPEAVVDVSGWETVSGSFDTPQLRGVYLFYVNPRLPGIYEVMRYRTSSPLGASRGLGDERVAFIAHPGAREPMLCWERQPAVPGWRAIAPETAEYRAEMQTLIRVLALHRPVRQDR